MSEFDINDFAAWVLETHGAKLTLRDAMYVEALVHDRAILQTRQAKKAQLSKWYSEYRKVDRDEQLLR